MFLISLLPSLVFVCPSNCGFLSCLEERTDKIFYTGSPNVGKHVMEMASKNLIPVTLELGGETGNWAIIRKDANLKDAARKIAFFKICNSGHFRIRRRNR